MNTHGEPPQDPEAPRILIVRVGAMGDVLHGMPAIAALRAAMPNAFIGWAIEPRWAPLLTTSGSGNSAQPLVDTVHMVEAKAWSKQPFSFDTFRSIRTLRHYLRGERYDIAIDLQGSIRSALIARTSGAARIIGNAHPREMPARWFYDERITTTMPHVVDQAAEIVSAAAGKPLQALPVPLPVDVEAEAWCDALFANDTRPAAFLAPTAGWGAKQWPAHRYGELAGELTTLGYRVLVNASPHGSDTVAAEVIQASKKSAETVACTLPQLTALLRRVQLVIAGDSGPLHLAAALGLRVVALFGPTDPTRNGPYGTRSLVLRHASSQTDHRRRLAAETGLASIPADDVIEAALQLLQQGSALPPARG